MFVVKFDLEMSRPAVVPLDIGRGLHIEPAFQAFDAEVDPEMVADGEEGDEDGGEADDEL